MSVKAMKQWLKALEGVSIEYDFHGNPVDEDSKLIAQAITSLRKAIELQEIHEARSAWVGLTYGDIMELSESRLGCERYDWVKRIIKNTEAKLKEKNT